MITWSINFRTLLFELTTKATNENAQKAYQKAPESAYEKVTATTKPTKEYEAQKPNSLRILTNYKKLSGLPKTVGEYQQKLDA